MAKVHCEWWRFKNFIEFGRTKPKEEEESFLYLIPTIIIQPPGKHYPDYASVYICWLNLYIMIGDLKE